MVDVLIVEDTEVQARLIVNFITDQHTVVGWARTQQKAVSLTQSKNPEIAIIDLNLHDGDGITTTEVINSYDETISIIVSTVSVSNETKQRALDAGADTYLNKPYSQNILLNVINQLS
jgi:DNA-binding response OmpR family regulator